MGSSLCCGNSAATCLDRETATAGHGAAPHPMAQVSLQGPPHPNQFNFLLTSPWLWSTHINVPSTTFQPRSLLEETSTLTKSPRGDRLAAEPVLLAAEPVLPAAGLEGGTAQALSSGEVTGGRWGEQTLSTVSQPPRCKPPRKELALLCISSRLQQLLILFRDSCSFLGGIWTIFLSGDTQLLICDPPQHWDDSAGMATITLHCSTFPGRASPASSGSHHRPPPALPGHCR